MTDILDKFDAAIAEVASLKFEGPDPLGVVIEETISETEAIIDGRRTILAGTNNYMGMTFHPEAMEAAREALEKHGTGTTGSRILNGTYKGHKALEAELAKFFGTDHAMVFSTGYQANLGIISALGQRGDYIIIDADSHASIYDGCAMGNADIVRFRHNNVEDLRKRLARLPKDAPKLVVLESIYSMLGDQAPLKEMLEVAKEAGAQTLVDEAHSMGFCGETGRGLAQELGVEHLCDFIVGTFSKSVGTVGGFCVSNHPKFEVLRFMSRPYMFTASLPPSVVASALASVRVLAHSGNRRAHLWENSKRLHKGLMEAGFTMGTKEAESPIISLIMPEQEILFKFWQALLKEGAYVNVARPPATPTGIFLVRCSLSAGHSNEQIDQLLEKFKTAAEKVGVPLKQAAE
ncbi:MAG: aminotransferase class I/II-fold pyridoxal phosphate-dependent enzyme [Sphingomonadales bacterium]|jgi:glycine C-acetyltransferase/8-amino-7-oxononanoate synthase